MNLLLNLNDILLKTSCSDEEWSKSMIRIIHIGYENRGEIQSWHLAGPT